MLYLHEHRQKAQNVSIMLKTRLLVLPAKMDLGLAFRMPALPQAPPPGQFRRLLTIRQLNQTPHQHHGLKLKNKRKVQVA